MSQLEIGLQGCSVSLKTERFDSFRRYTKVIKRRHSSVPSDVRILSSGLPCDVSAIPSGVAEESKDAYFFSRCREVEGTVYDFRGKQLRSA